MFFTFRFWFSIIKFEDLYTLKTLSILLLLSPVYFISTPTLCYICKSFEMLAVDL